MSNDLADRIRENLADDPNIAEIRMFGGLCFTLNGNMLVGTMKDGGLLVRVGDEQDDEALARPGASPMNFTGRQMKGFVVVSSETLDDRALREWIAMATRHVGAMPPKKPAENKKPTKR